jgi:hypothetical protein
VTARPPRFQSASEQRERAASPELGGLGTLEYAARIDTAAQTGHWLRGLGRVDGLACPDPGLDEVRDCLEESASGFGKLTVVRHAARMSDTPPHWARPSVPLGTHPPVWRE